MAARTRDFRKRTPYRKTLSFERPVRSAYRMRAQDCVLPSLRPYLVQVRPGRKILEERNDLGDDCL